MRVLTINSPECIIRFHNMIIDLLNMLFCRLGDIDWMIDRTILATTNSVVDEVNATVATKLPGQPIVCRSADSVIDPSEQFNVPVEFLNSLTMQGEPPHELVLKKGMPVMLLRNLCCGNGLCNGSRLIVEDLHGGKWVSARVATGPARGTRVCIPRIVFSCDELASGFRWRRLQFPLRPAFAMTIHKSQGQTLGRVGLYLKSPVFAHGQLYVALSRVSSSSDLSIAAPLDSAGRCRVRNVVYKNVLT